jgi:hypothetical protein
MNQSQKDALTNVICSIICLVLVVGSVIFWANAKLMKDMERAAIKQENERLQKEVTKLRQLLLENQIIPQKD